MKHISLAKQCHFFALGLLAVLATSCINEDLDVCKSNYKLTMAVQNAKGLDITALSVVSGASLYIFDENLNHLETRELDRDFITSREEIDLSKYPSNKKLHLIAWGNMRGDNQVIPDAKKLEDMTLMLKSQNGVASSPDSLYYGKKDITTLDGGLAAADTIAIRIKVGTITVKTVGVQNLRNFYGLKSTDNFDVTLNRTLSAYNYEGVQTGDSVSYMPKTIFDNEMTEWRTEGALDEGAKKYDTGGKQNIFAGENLSLAVERNGSFLTTVTEAKNEDGEYVPIVVPEGGRTDLLIDFAADGTISARIRVSPWGVVDDAIEF